MSTLYIRSALDMPHAASPIPTVAICGAWLAGARKITELQALVYLGDRRCVRCFPSVASRYGEQHAYASARAILREPEGTP